MYIDLNGRAWGLCVCVHRLEWQGLGTMCVYIDLNGGPGDYVCVYIDLNGGPGDYVCVYIDLNGRAWGLCLCVHRLEWKCLFWHAPN